MIPSTVIYVYTYSSPARKGAVRVGCAPVSEAVSPFLPANCDILKRISANKIKEGEGSAQNWTLRHCELSTWFDSKGRHSLTEKEISALLKSAGIHQMKPSETEGEKGWFLCPAETVISALHTLKHPLNATGSKQAGKASKKAASHTGQTGHGAADALDWDEAQRLIKSLYADGRYRDCLMVACGCYMGLRISDLLRFRWEDLTGKDTLTRTEKKTGKKRSFRINRMLQAIIAKCHDSQEIEDSSSYVFASPGTEGKVPITRQRADQILKECKERYNLTSAHTLSTHSLRKTFGRRVWLVECGKGRGEQALLLLCDVFGHSSIQITKRYLGIRQEEILSVYDNL